MFDNKSIFITGGTGSFGKRFISRLLSSYKPRRVIVYSRDELKQYEMSQKFNDPCMRYFIGDVRDLQRMEMAMREVDYVVHAAALKHVPIAEYNPTECIHTNVNGAENVVRAAISNNVKKVIALSTDKAANPINLYGASKLASDKIFIAGNNLSGSIGTRFAVVRYGNVVGSRGSVVPLFKRMVAQGATSLPITDERMTRFWITLDHGVDFVLSCFDMMVGGEVFVPKIPSMSVVDLACAMGPELDIDIVGIRPGEKLHEIMISEDDARNTLELDDRYIIEPSFTWWTRENYKLGKPLPEGFFYASNTNDNWLSEAELRDMVDNVDDEE